MQTEPIPISPGQLAERIEDGSPVVILDVRLPEDFDCGRLPGAKSNGVFEIAFEDRLTALAPDRSVPVCVYGAGRESRESGMAAEKLRRAGYAGVWDLRDGIEGWRAAGHAVVGGTAPPAASAPQWHGTREIDLVESRVEWIGRNLLNKHGGSIGLKSGRLEFDHGCLVSGEFVFDMNAIACADLDGIPLHDVLVGHLRGHDFFDTVLYPEARFEIAKARPAPAAAPGAPNLGIRGALTLKGVTHPIEFVAASGVTAEGRLAAQATLAFDRTLWNVIYGSGKFFRNLGGHLVNDLIDLQIRIVA